ncbi:MAG: MGMT family protein, partial [Verrucomicrobiota bacterium]
MIIDLFIPNTVFRRVTKIAPISAEFSSKGLKKLDYRNFDDLPATDDKQLTERFFAWLDQYEQSTAAEKWEMLDPDGTSFQKKIWQELLKVPFGKTVSYGELANAIGKPLAARA